MIQYFVSKRVFDFPRSCFYYLFMKLFLFQSKTKNAVKNINKIFTSNKLNDKTSEKNYFVNIWSFNWFILKFLWEVGARQSKKCLPGSNYLLWNVLPGSTNYFLMKPSDTSIINSVFQNKSWFTREHDTPCFFWRVKRSYLNHSSHLNPFKTEAVTL